MHIHAGQQMIVLGIVCHTVGLVGQQGDYRKWWPYYHLKTTKK